MPMLQIVWDVMTSLHLSKEDIIAGPVAKCSVPNVQAILWLYHNLVWIVQYECAIVAIYLLMLICQVTQPLQVQIVQTQFWTLQVLVPEIVRPIQDHLLNGIDTMEWFHDFFYRFILLSRGGDRFF